MADAGTAVAIVCVVLFILLLLYKATWVVGYNTAIVFERFGVYTGTLRAGLHFVIPFVDSPRKIVWRESETYEHGTTSSVEYHEQWITRIDLRENVMDFPSQAAITRDNVEIRVHPMLLFQLVNPVRVAYETYDLSHAVEKLVQTTLRSIIGDMGLDDTLASREEINRALTQKIANVCYNWGVQINRVELLEITPSHSVQSAMHMQLSAERIRRAAIVSADGQREKMKTIAEGDCQAKIAVATGSRQVSVTKATAEAEARVLVAQAEADAIRVVGSAVAELDVNPTDYLIALAYIGTFKTLALTAASRLVYMPIETDLGGALNVINT